MSAARSMARPGFSAPLVRDALHDARWLGRNSVPIGPPQGGDVRIDRRGAADDLEQAGDAQLRGP
jgi:hypothetical protein